MSATPEQARPHGPRSTPAQRKLRAASQAAFGWLLHADAISPARLERQIRDFCAGAQDLYWQRQGMYFGSGLLAAFYYDPVIGFYCFSFLQITEALDSIVAQKVADWKGGSLRRAIRLRNLLLATSTLSSIAVGYFAIQIARVEGADWHFVPLFFMFAAGLFAAVNNHQLPSVLFVRLIVYGLVFLYIPIRDIIDVNPPLSSNLWLQFMTVVFVLFFVINCSIIFLMLYRQNLDRVDELRTERDRAQQAYEVKSQFVSVVSHELRTPLHSIMGSLSLLNSTAGEDVDERSSKLLRIAHSNSQRLSKLINDLLDLQRLESGSMIYHMQPVELQEIVNDAMMSVEGTATERDVELRIMPQSEDVAVNVDPSKFQQVVTNLLSNAVKFSHPQSHVEIVTTRSEDRAILAVTDFGVGIPPNTREKVFGTFSQVDSSDQRAHEGSGLGLAIAEQIVRAHGGTIDYDSEVGLGTTFRIDLPIAGPEAGE